MEEFQKLTPAEREEHLKRAKEQYSDYSMDKTSGSNDRELYSPDEEL